MMLGMDIALVGIVTSDATPENGLISLIGITGDWVGAGVFCCSPKLASVICGRMLGSEPDADGPRVDEEVMDVVAELTNMVIGNIKNGLESVTGPLAISVPSVIHGRNFQFRNAAKPDFAALMFETEGEPFQVRLSLTESSDAPALRARVPIIGLAHM